MRFESSKLYDIKKWQSIIQEIYKFLKLTFEFLSKHFAENRKGKLFLNDSSFLSNWQNTKASTILTI